MNRKINVSMVLLSKVSFVITSLVILFFLSNVLHASILVISPHPDDDVICAAGIIYGAVQRQETVNIVYLTNGDLYGGVPLGYQRQTEAVNAATEHLALNEDNLIFLGYPDGYLETIVSSYTRPEDIFTTGYGQSTTYGNRGLGRTDYHTYLFGTPAIYNKPNIIGDLKSIIYDKRPSHIIVTSYYDTHSDHRVAYELLRDTLYEIAAQDPGYLPVIHETIIHTGEDWPQPADPTVCFSEIPNLSATNVDWSSRESYDVPYIMQSTDYSLNPKFQAIALHASQGGNNGFLGRFLHKDEIFWARNILGPNRPPVVNAGNDQVVQPGTSVQLDGSMSFDPDGNGLTYQWQQVSGIPITLSDDTSARPSFTIPSGLEQNQLFSFQLIINDGQFSSLPDTVMVLALADQVPPPVTYDNIAPLATVTASSQTTAYQQLATKAVDRIIDGYPGDYTREWATTGERAGAWLRLQWDNAYLVDRVVLYDRPNADDRVLSGTISFSDGSTVQVGSLNNDGSPTEFTFSPRIVTGLTFTVNSVASSTYNIGLAEIEVYGELSGSINHPPVANAGDDMVVAASTEIQLDGSASYDPDSNDILTYQWTQISGMVVQLSNPTAIRPRFIAPSNIVQPLTLSFQLTVTDSHTASSSDIVNITIVADQSNHPPVANAGSDQVAAAGTTVQLDGSSSFDPEGDQLYYHWQQVTGPWVSLSNTASARPTFTAPANNTTDQLLTFQLTVSDGELESSPDIVNILILADTQPASSNIAPLATVTASSQTTAYQQLATKAVDRIIDGYPGDYTREWATTGERAGAWLRLQWDSAYLVDRVVLYDRPNADDRVLSGTISFSDGSTVQVGSLNNDGSPTEFTFSPRIVTGLTFTVNSVASSTYNIGLAEIEVYGELSGSINHPPVANAGSDQVAAAGTTVQLDGSSSFDPEGDQLYYHWQQVTGPWVSLSSTTSARPIFTAPANNTTDQLLTFQLMVSDGELESSPDIVNILILSDTQPASSNIAPLATVTASSQTTAYQQLATKAVDRIIDGYPGDYTREWATTGERAGAWLRLQWDSAYLVDRVVLYDRPNADDRVLSGTISFSDGSTVQVGSLNNDGSPTEFTFSPRIVTGLTFTVNSVASSTYNIGLAEIEVYGILAR